MCAPRYTTCSCLIHIVIINNIIEVLVIVLVRCQSVVVLSMYYLSMYMEYNGISVFSVCFCIRRACYYYLILLFAYIY